MAKLRVAPHNARLIRRGVADVTFLLQAHRLLHLCAVAYLIPVLGWSIVKAGGEGRSCCGYLSGFAEISLKQVVLEGGITPLLVSKRSQSYAIA